MAASPVKPWALVAAAIKTGGVPVVAAYGPLQGGFIVNPYGAADQGLAVIENLYVDLVGPAAAMETATTKTVPPGKWFQIPPGFSGQVSVNAASSGHKYAGIVLQPPPGFQPSTGSFPPSGPTTLTVLGGLASYLYQEYADDDDLQVYVMAFNAIAQEYLTFLAGIGLPVYTGLNGALLDWIAANLYGELRPVLPSGRSRNIGPYNTFRFNQLRFNQVKIVSPATFFATTDDVFKRILTWNLWKGDGRAFNVRWLKRRVVRFLTGINGTAGQTDTTYQVSVTFGPDGEININLQSTRRYVTGGALFGVGRFNNFRFNQLNTRTVMIPVSPLVPIFKAAMDAGVLQMPFQNTTTVNVN